MKLLVQFFLLPITIFSAVFFAQFALAQSDENNGQQEPYTQEQQMELGRLRRILEERRTISEQEKLRSEEGIPSKVVKETCPAGYKPSEKKCSESEKKRGCKDVTLPQGLECVSR